LLNPITAENRAPRQDFSPPPHDAVHSTLGCTPAVGLKLATETWTIEELIEEAAK